MNTPSHNFSQQSEPYSIGSRVSSKESSTFSRTTASKREPAMWFKYTEKNSRIFSAKIRGIGLTYSHLFVTNALNLVADSCLKRIFNKKVTSDATASSVPPLHLHLSSPSQSLKDGFAADIEAAAKLPLDYSIDLSSIRIGIPANSTSHAGLLVIVSAVNIKNSPSCAPEHPSIDEVKSLRLRADVSFFTSDNIFAKDVALQMLGHVRDLEVEMYNGSNNSSEYNLISMNNLQSSPGLRSFPQLPQGARSVTLSPSRSQTHNTAKASIKAKSASDKDEMQLKFDISSLPSENEKELFDTAALVRDRLAPLLSKLLPSNSISVLTASAGYPSKPTRRAMNQVLRCHVEERRIKAKVASFELQISPYQLSILTLVSINLKNTQAKSNSSETSENSRKPSSFEFVSVPQQESSILKDSKNLGTMSSLPASPTANFKFGSPPYSIQSDPPNSSEHSKRMRNNSGMESEDVPSPMLQSRSLPSPPLDPSVREREWSFALLYELLLLDIQIAHICLTLVEDSVPISDTLGNFEISIRDERKNTKQSFPVFAPSRDCGLLRLSSKLTTKLSSSAMQLQIDSMLQALIPSYGLYSKEIELLMRDACSSQRCIESHFSQLSIIDLPNSTDILSTPTLAENSIQIKPAISLQYSSRVCFESGSVKLPQSNDCMPPDFPSRDFLQKTTLFSSLSTAGDKSPTAASADNFSMHESDPNPCEAIQRQNNRMCVELSDLCVSMAPVFPRLVQLTSLFMSKRSQSSDTQSKDVPELIMESKQAKYHSTTVKVTNCAVLFPAENNYSSQMQSNPQVLLLAPASVALSLNLSLQMQRSSLPSSSFSTEYDLQEEEKKFDSGNSSNSRSSVCNDDFWMQSNVSDLKFYDLAQLYCDERVASYCTHTRQASGWDRVFSDNRDYSTTRHILLDPSGFRF